MMRWEDTKKRNSLQQDSQLMLLLLDFFESHLSPSSGCPIREQFSHVPDFKMCENMTSSVNAIAMDATDLVEENEENVYKDIETSTENDPESTENDPESTENFPESNENFPDNADNFPVNAENFPEHTENSPMMQCTVWSSYMHDISDSSCLKGWVKDQRDLSILLDIFQKSTNTSFVKINSRFYTLSNEVDFTSAKRVWWADRDRDNPLIPFIGQPFICGSTVRMQCHHGPPKQQYNKINKNKDLMEHGYATTHSDDTRTNSDDTSMTNFDDTTTRTIKKRSSKKFNCPARITIKKVAVFGGKDLHVSTRCNYEERVRARMLKEEMSKLDYSYRYYVCLPTSEHHHGHSVSNKDHIRAHTGKRPHGCGICDKRFSTLKYLKEHIRAHERPHNCCICDRKFATERGLKEHMRIHTDEKPPQCDICNKTFMTTSGLNRHLKTHY